ncbi:MAG: chaperone [Rubritepida sp.]|nr:chaperone [Rubritepida sp.]
MMKRFWDQAACVAEGGSFAIHLDGKPMRLPGGGTLRVATRELGEALAAEWQVAGGAREGEMSWDDVPLTRLAGTAVERIAPKPEATIAAIAKYAETDLICYRATDPALAERQNAAWDDWLEWAARDLGAVLQTTTGIMPVRQSDEAIAALHDAVAELSPVALSALGVLVPSLGSAVLGLAVLRGALEPAEAHRLALVDEVFQEEKWGLDWETEERREKVAADLVTAARLAALSAP